MSSPPDAPEEEVGEEVEGAELLAAAEKADEEEGY